MCMYDATKDRDCQKSVPTNQPQPSGSAGSAGLTNRLCGESRGVRSDPDLIRSDPDLIRSDPDQVAPSQIWPGSDQI